MKTFCSSEEIILFSRLYHPMCDAFDSFPPPSLGFDMGGYLARFQASNVTPGALEDGTNQRLSSRVVYLFLFVSLSVFNSY